MKKTLMLIFITISFFLTSCIAIIGKEKQSTENENNTKGIYRDGIYTEEGDIWRYGNENATITVKSGRITEIILRKLDNTGKEVNYEEWSLENTNDGKKPNLKEYRLDLAKKMLDKQSYDVEAVAGATISSENWKTAVKKALDKAGK